jgi:hypothetical protein
VNERLATGGPFLITTSEGLGVDVLMPKPSSGALAQGQALLAIDHHRLACILFGPGRFVAMVMVLSGRDNPCIGTEFIVRSYVNNKRSPW